jgi:hypothetical protein
VVFELDVILDRDVHLVPATMPRLSMPAVTTDELSMSGAGITVLVTTGAETEAKAEGACT